MPLPQDFQAGPFESEAEFERFRAREEREAERAGHVVAVTRIMKDGRLFADIRFSAGAGTPKPSVNPDIPPVPPVPGMDDPAPPPAGPPSRFIAARRTGPMAVTYIDADGRDVLREGGSRSWRNNNPGNIRKGSFTESQGAIGDDGSFGIFADAKQGLDAIVALLRTASYRNLSLRDGIFRYAPPSENESERYLAFVVAETGLAATEVLGTMTGMKLAKIARAIQRMEGWREGTERPNAPASQMLDLARAARQAAGASAAQPARREWMTLAEAEAALPIRERSAWADPEENPRILEYFRLSAAWFEPDLGDETDWCAAFVNACLIRSGHIGTDHPGARSFFWNRKGQFIRLAGPVPGAIAVRRHAPFDDPDWKTGRGHVGFVTSFTATTVTLLGGNQGQTVKVQSFPLEVLDQAGRPASSFVAFMMPVMN
jgi:uncharacterized protein (TIGR02594 family)